MLVLDKVDHHRGTILTAQGWERKILVQLRKNETGCSVRKMHLMGGWRYIRGSIFDSKAGRVWVVSDFGVYTDLKPPGLWG